MFRKIDIADFAAGRLYFHSMPGRFEKLANTLSEIRRNEISRIVCLTPDHEIEEKSPEYWQMMSSNKLPVETLQYPIPDYDTPSNLGELLEISNQISEYLISGENILIHCAAGLGRTGLMAICILVSLGLDLNYATHLVGNAGSGPQNSKQKMTLTHFYSLTLKSKGA